MNMYRDRVLIVTPFRNESHSVKHYLNAINKITYPKKLIDLVWVENDSSDDTFELLEANQPTGFHYFQLRRVNLYGLNKVKKCENPKSYVKDIPYSAARRKSWVRLWNNQFIPLIKESNCKLLSRSGPD